MAAEYLPSSNTTQLLNEPSVRNSAHALFMLRINSQQKAMLKKVELLKGFSWFVHLIWR